MDKIVSVLDIPTGYTRLGAHKNRDKAGYTIIISRLDEKHDLHSELSGDETYEPLMGIVINSSDSARAYARFFERVAESIDKE